MHCLCCDKLLTDYEATRRNAMTKEFIDLCNKCYGTISNDVLAIERQDLRHEEDTEENDYLLYEDNTLDYLSKKQLDNEN